MECTNTQQSTNQKNEKSYNGKALEKPSQLWLSSLENKNLNIKRLNIYNRGKLNTHCIENISPKGSVPFNLPRASWSGISTLTFQMKRNKIDSDFTIQQCYALGWINSIL